MTTAIIDGATFSKQLGEKAVVNKKVAKIHETVSHPRREYDDFASALQDVKEGRIHRLDISTFAEEVRVESHRRAK